VQSSRRLKREAGRNVEVIPKVLTIDPYDGPKSPAGKERRITRWEHEHLLEDIQARLDAHPDKMRQCRETVEQTFGNIKPWMGSTHFLMKTLKIVRTEMALHVFAYNLKRVMNIIGIGPLMAAIRAQAVVA
jgi:transposase